MTCRVLYTANPKKNSKCFSEFLSQFLGANANRFLILVLDDDTYHRTAEILDILSYHKDRVYVVWLPKKFK
jgi:hypothetical protein